MNRASCTLKLMLLLDNGRFSSGLPIHAQVPHRDAKNESADLQRTGTQAGRTIVWRG
jgi:hypothetical protein